MSNKYHYIIVGGGPAGILTAYNLANYRSKSKILILEKNEKTLQDYVNKDYDEIANWYSAQSDPDFQYSFQSEDDKSVWMGKGLGGGTLHFGLQYIDQDKLIEKNHEYLRPYFKELEEIVKAESYNYGNNEPNEAWIKLYNHINQNKDTNTLLMNNKIYGTDINNNDRERIQLGDLLKNFKNINIEYGKSVKNINIEDKMANYLTTFDGKKYYAGKIILCAGAIQTPAILQRSDIDCGNKLYDHAGFTLTYSKYVPAVRNETIEKKVKKTTTQAYQGDKIFTLNRDNIRLLNENNSGRYIYNVSGGPGNTNVYDFTSWARIHSGGRNKITKWAQSDEEWDSKNSSIYKKRSENNNMYQYQLNFPHGSGFWSSGINSGSIKKIGLFNGNIDYDKLKSLGLQNKTLEKILFPDKQVTEEVTEYETKEVSYDKKVDDLGFVPEKYIGHLQTRNDDLTWQTYYSTISFLKDSLILTYAQSTNLSGNGSVKIQNKEEDVNPIVTLNHFMDNKEDKLEENEDYIDDLVDCFITNHLLLISYGYKLNNFENTTGITPDENALNQLRNYFKNIVKQQANSIYHYHGSTAEIVDDYNKVKDVKNLYIGDISTFSKPWGGSTSVPAAANGLFTSKNIMVEEKKEKTYAWWYDEGQSKTNAWWYDEEQSKTHVWWYNKN